MKVFYFGCGSKSDIGHHHFRPDMSVTIKERDWQPPWEYGSVDGGLAPKGPEIEGSGLLHHKDGWTAWAFWDRSADDRLGSNSVFFAEGEHDLEQMQELAKEYFPNVWGRLSGLKFTIKEEAQ